MAEIRPQTVVGVGDAETVAKLQAARAAAEVVKHWRMLGTAFDALVRSARAGDPSTGAVAGRVLELWRAQPGATLEVNPTELRVGPHVALGASSEDGRWILPAFMAGLRGLKPRTAAVVEDARHLGEELSSLEANLVTITRFRDWLWSDGAQGFEVDLHASFVEVMDDLPATEAGTLPSIMASRSEAAVAGFNDVLYIASRDLDAAAVREEFGVPVTLFEEKARAGSLSPGADERERLRSQCEDAASWSAAEMEAVMDNPELRSSMPSQRLARRLVSLAEIAEVVDARLLGFLTILGRRDDAYSRAVVMALDTDGLGQTLARKVPLDRRHLAALEPFLGAAPPAVGRGLVHGLLHRAAGDEPAFEALMQLSASAGVQTLVARVEPSAIPGRAAAVLARILIARNEPLPIVRDLVLRLGPRASAAILASQAGVLAAMRPRALELLTRHPDDSRELVQALLASRRPEDLRLVAEAVTASSAAGWPPKLLATTLGALVAGGLGAGVVVPLARGRAADADARLAALDALGAQPALLAEAIRWSPTEMLDPPEVRKRVQEERKRVKGSA